VIVSALGGVHAQWLPPLQDTSGKWWATLEEHAMEAAGTQCRVSGKQTVTALQQPAQLESNLD